MSSAKWRPFCLGLNVLTPACVTAIRLVKHVNDHHKIFPFIRKLLTHCHPGDVIYFECKHNVGIDIMNIQLNIILEWMPEDLADG